MGAGQSSASQFPSRALHVLRVTPSSPASHTSIEPFFDFVVGFQEDDRPSSSTTDIAELEKIVESHEGRSLNLLVWNSKSKSTRVVPIVPSRQWSLQPPGVPDSPDSDRKPSLLGLSMRMCEPEFSLDNVWHVLDVLEGSPAESAGLVPYGDWIIGWSGGVLNAEGDFYDVVEAHIEKSLRVYVYSYDFDNIREVVLVPNRHWGGEGLLGCVFGFGLLHRIPPLPENRQPGSVPAELLQSPDGFQEQQLFVPADFATADMETPEQAEERIRWEEEEWERESYARNYAQYAANETPSAYVDLAELEHDASPTDISPGEEVGPPITRPDTPPARYPGVEAVQANEVIPPVAEAPSTPAASRRSSLFGPARASTPTPTRPFGPYMNGIGVSPRTPSWDFRGAMFDGAHRDAASRDPGGLNGDDALDGMSVAETELTELSSEVTSEGSLTSVD